MAFALGLPDALRARGLTVEVVPGWETRSAGSFNPHGAVAHWTAGPRGATGRPSLNVVVNGRPGLDGPLCNVYGARDGVAVVVAAGRANHAGAGSWRGLVGNSSVFGTEMEGADAADFTAAQRWAYPRIHAAYCDLGSFGPDMNCGHSEWAGPRKIDINGYTPADLRRDIAAVLATAPGRDWFDMATKEDLVSVIRSEGVSGAGDIGRLQQAIRAMLPEIGRAVLCLVPEDREGAWAWDRLAHIEELAQSIAEKIGGGLSGGSGGGISRDDVKAAVQEALREGTGAPANPAS